MIISVSTEKTCDKIQHPFTIKTLIKVDIEGTYLNIIKAIYNKPMANIKLNIKKLKDFLLNSGIRQRCPLLPLLFNIMAIRQEIKGIQIGRSKNVTICR